MFERIKSELPSLLFDQIIDSINSHPYPSTILLVYLNPGPMGVPQFIISRCAAWLQAVIAN
jgi:hypothetical protein